MLRECILLYECKLPVAIPGESGMRHTVCRGNLYQEDNKYSKESRLTLAFHSKTEEVIYKVMNLTKMDENIYLDDYCEVCFWSLANTLEALISLMMMS